MKTRILLTIALYGLILLYIPLFGIVLGIIVALWFVNYIHKSQKK